jgi:hypothetical protein
LGPEVSSEVPPASNTSAGPTLHPPVATASQVERVHRTAPDVDGLDARRGRGRASAQQQAAPTTPGHLPFGALTVDRASQATSADGWPSGIRFEFKAPKPDGMPATPESTPSRPRRVNTSDFDNGIFRDFTAPGALKMCLPGLFSTMPFTPPPSTDNTPLKQAPAKTPRRPGSPCDGRGNSWQSLARATLPTPEPTPDETTGRGRDRPVLKVFGDN